MHMIIDRQEEFPQPDSVDHIFQILNDVKAEELPVSDAIDSLAYWYHEAFSNGAITVEGQDASPQFPPTGNNDIWT